MNNSLPAIIAVQQDDGSWAAYDDNKFEGDASALTVGRGDTREEALNDFVDACEWTEVGNGMIKQIVFALADREDAATDRVAIAEEAALSWRKKTNEQSYRVAVLSNDLARAQIAAAPSREWFAENLAHHIKRGDEEEIEALKIVAAMALTGVDYDWMIVAAKTTLDGDTVSKVRGVQQKRDAQRYRKLRSIGAAPNGTPQLGEGLVLAAQILDEWIDKTWPIGDELRTHAVLQELPRSTINDEESDEQSRIYQGH